MNESRAARHQRIRRRAQAAGVLSGGTLLTVLAFTPVGRGFAGWATSIAEVLPKPLAPAGALMVFVSMLVCVWEIATLPAVLFTGPDRPGRGASAEPSSVRAVVTGGLVALCAALLVCAGIQVAAWLTGDWWWLAGGAFVAAVLVVVMHTAPGVLARLSGARPVTRPALVERLGALSRRIQVPIESIDELPAGAAATSTALVAGGGSARRVFIASELIQDWSDEEVAIVVAHEFAHHAHHDLWLTLALDVVLLVAGFWTADALARSLAVPFGLPAIGDLGALPFVALVVAGVWVVAAPLRNAVSRNQERRADDFALRITGSADAFRTALRRLASRHLAEERPSRLTRWMFHRHPSVAERLATADRYEECRTAYRSIDPSVHRSN